MGNGSPVIIVHGLFGMSDNWMNIAKQLADHHKVYLPDMRNHGSSPHHEEWSYDVMAEDLTEFIELHKINRSWSHGINQLGSHKVCGLFAAS
jgi:esterase